MGDSHAGVRGESNGSEVTAEARQRNIEVVLGLDAFLDELAEGHRRKMEEIVAWITENGSLDREVEGAVNALAPLLQRWCLEICFLLRMRDVMRFGELQKALNGIGSRTLSQRLKDLEGQGIVLRRAYAEVPVRVEYSLTPKGLKMADLFLPVIAHLRIAGLRERGRLGPDGPAPARSP